MPRVFVVLVGTAPGVYDSEAAAIAARGHGKYTLMKPCDTEMEARQQLRAFAPSTPGAVLHTVYTDGACSNNGRRSAQAGIGVFWGDADPRNVSRPVSGLHTNNVAELEAINVALTTILEMVVSAGSGGAGAEFRIVTDSKYAVQCLEEWFDGWRARGWKTASG